MSGDPLLRFRDEFPILEECTYLVSHSLGAMPRGAAQGLERYAKEWGGRGVRAWDEGWWDLPVTLGDRIAPLLGAPTGTIAMQPNVTLAAAIFLSAIEFRPPRNRLVTTALDFPSLLYLFRGIAGRGAEVVEVPSPDGVVVPAERLLEAIDERTRVVAISHVLFRSSYAQDVSAVAARANAMGALMLLDVYQSAGCMPVDLFGLGVDAAVGGCLKWLCGGPGNAFLFVRPELSERLRPRITGWQAHREPFAFDTAPFEPGDGPWRFLHGTPPIPSHRAAEAGIALVAKAGIEAIREKSIRQSSRIMERCDEEGWSVRTPRQADSRGGTVTFDPGHPYEISRALVEREVLVDFRENGGIRMAPHFYSSDSEIDHALDEVASIVRDGSWKKFRGPKRSTVT